MSLIEYWNDQHELKLYKLKATFIKRFKVMNGPFNSVTKF